MIEGLESRQMLSASLTPHGLLMVKGTNHPDAITVTMDTQDPTEMDVTMNGVMKQFFAANVKSININGAGGNDSINVDPSVTSPASVQGAAGNDSLVAGAGADSLNGGAGNDSLTGGTGTDVLAGAAGNDTITCGAGNDMVNGGVGHDSVQFSPSAGAPLSTLPASVQTGLTTLAQGATVGTAEAFQDNGQTYYGTDVTVSGVDTRIVVDVSGAPVGNAPPAKGKNSGGGQGPGSGQAGPAQNAGIFGSVVSVDTTADTITVSATNPWGPVKQTTFKLTSATTISADSATVTLADLSAGTLVCVQTSSTDASTATSITAIDKRVGGVVSAIDTTADTIAITDPSGTATTFSISSSATVTLDGTASTLASVTVGANVQLTLSALGGTVISIQSNPQAVPPANGGTPPAPPVVPSGIGGSVVSVDTTADTITIANGIGTQTTFTLAGSATVDLDGASSTLSALVAGDRVELTLTTGATTVASIEASDQTTPPPNPTNPGTPAAPSAVFGLVVSVDTTADTITIQCAGAASPTTYTLSTTATVSLDGATSTLGALIAGDSAGLQLASDGVTVNSVTASDQGQPAGPGGPPPTGSTGTPGQNLSPFGQVASVDTTADTITIADRSGTSTTYTLSSTATVNLDGKASTLSALVAGDQAKLQLSSDGTSVISIQATDQAPPPVMPGGPGGPGGQPG
ncbi:MAG TPA: hypothetical protein VFE47_00695 [Tepidisphaeraceae bacterium]|jgi:hypothetical protein|nr:hypothetical protein [Tepidisphaeraceae bacterium]